MQIPERFHSEIRAIDVNLHKVRCEYSYWKDKLGEKESVYRRVCYVERHLASKFGRLELARGPWKVSKMFKSINAAPTLLASVSIDTRQDLKRSYKTLMKGIEQCGPNFFTKHLYFLGKSEGGDSYPLIFDDRVAFGLVQLFLKGRSCTELIAIHAKANPEAYLKYLEFIRAQARKISCAPDQIEYFLFKHGRST